MSGTYRVDEEVEIARISRVTAYTGDIAADFADCVVELVFAAAGDVDVSPFGDEEFGCGQTMPAVAPVMTATCPCSFVMGVSSCVR